MFALGLVWKGGGVCLSKRHVSRLGRAEPRGSWPLTVGPRRWTSLLPITAARGACVLAGAPYCKPGSEALQRGPHRDGGLRSGIGRCVHPSSLCWAPFPTLAGSLASARVAVVLGKQGLRSAELTQPSAHNKGE